MTRAEDDPRIVWESCADEAAWVQRSVDVIAAALQVAQAQGAPAKLLLSGGSTPVPVYRALAVSPVDWSRVVVGLVDDRDVEPDHDGSNARLVCEALASSAGVRFRPLRGSGQSLASAVAGANADPAIDPHGAIVVLGMGEDGHTASLFPQARDLDPALTGSLPYARIDATGCAGAGRFPLRITLTARGLAVAAARILLLRGAAKRAVFERALAAGDVRELPIRAAIASSGTALHVLWCGA